MPWIQPVLEHYMRPLIMAQSQCVILGCTHYSLLLDQIQNLAGQGTAILSQGEIIPGKLADYLNRHPEIAGDIGRTGKARYVVSDLTDSYKKAAESLYGGPLNIEKIQEAQ